MLVLTLQLYCSSARKKRTCSISCTHYQYRPLTCSLSTSVARVFKLPQWLKIFLSLLYKKQGQFGSSPSPSLTIRYCIRNATFTNVFHPFINLSDFLMKESVIGRTLFTLLNNCLFYLQLLQIRKLLLQKLHVV